MPSTAVARIEKLGLAKYDAMQHAIAVAVAVDEVKDIRDKLIALEKYAAQANNFEAEKRVASLRIEAELKAGELLKVTEKARGNGSNQHRKVQSSQRERNARTLKEMGVSETQSSRWQKLAEDPKAVKRYLREEEGVPTTAAALQAVAPAPKRPAATLPFSDEALWFTSRLRDLVKADIDPAKIVKGCDDDLRTDNRKHIDILIPILRKVRSLL